MLAVVRDLILARRCPSMGFEYISCVCGCVCVCVCVCLFACMFLIRTASRS